jgi:hypothetical protein
LKKLLNSFELADLLLARDFVRISKATRTKAHSFVHPRLAHPIYVKVNGGGQKGPVEPATEAPLVVHQEDHQKISSAGSLSGVRLKALDYTSAGLLKFNAGDGKTPRGCDYWIDSAAALDALLSSLGMAPVQPLPAPVGPEHTATEHVDDGPALGTETPSVRQALIDARVGQDDYRRNLMALWGERCAVTGCSITAALIASHAKPWSACETTQERLDKYNGLLLCASIDKLFDRGLISFAEDGLLLRKPGLSDDDLAHLGLRPDARLRADCLRPSHLPYLAAHRKAHGF